MPASKCRTGSGRDRRGFRWDAETLAPRGEFACAPECWGLTQDGESLIMSDGTATLSFLDAETMGAPPHPRDRGRPATFLNALQWVEGEIFANVLGFPGLLRIDPASGRVTSMVDLTPIAAAAAGGDQEKLANGIAWDAERRRLFVTGNNWPHVYEIALAPAPSG